MTGRRPDPTEPAARRARQRRRDTRILLVVAGIVSLLIAYSLWINHIFEQSTG